MQEGNRSMPIEDVTLGEVYRLILAQGQTVERLSAAVVDLKTNLTREVQELVSSQVAAQVATIRDLDTRVKKLEESAGGNTLTQKVVFGAVGLVLVAVVGALIALVVTNGPTTH